MSWSTEAPNEMDAERRHREGGCRCGQLRFQFTGAPLITLACHCRGCQRMTGGPYSTSVTVPTGRFAVTAGQAVIGGVGDPAMHHHCPKCFSWVFTRMEGWSFVNLRTSMLDDPTGLDPFVETQTADRLPFATTGAVRSFKGFPDDAEWPELMKDYALASAGRAPWTTGINP